NTPIAIGVRVSPAPWSDALPAYVSDQNGMPTAAAFKYTVPWCRASGSAPSSFSQELPRNHITNPTSIPHATAIMIALPSVGQASRMTERMRCSSSIAPGGAAIASAASADIVRLQSRTGTYASHYGKRVAAIDTGAPRRGRFFVRKRNGWTPQAHPLSAVVTVDAPLGRFKIAATRA